MVRNDVPPAVGELFRNTLLQLAQTQQGRDILAGMETARFHAADDASYDVVRDYVLRFEHDVRPVQEP